MNSRHKIYHEESAIIFMVNFPLFSDKEVVNFLVHDGWVCILSSTIGNQSPVRTKVLVHYDPLAVKGARSRGATKAQGPSAYPSRRGFEMLSDFC